MADEFRIIVTTYPDMDELVAEIWLADELFAGIYHLEGTLECELYPKDDGKPWKLSADTLFQAIGQARQRLGGVEK